MALFNGIYMRARPPFLKIKNFVNCLLYGRIYNRIVILDSEGRIRFHFTIKYLTYYDLKKSLPFQMGFLSHLQLPTIVTKSSMGLQRWIYFGFFVQRSRIIWKPFSENASNPQNIENYRNYTHAHRRHQVVDAGSLISQGRSLAPLKSTLLKMWFTLFQAFLAM